MEGAWLFQQPVDVQAWKIFDYYDIVKNPMDLGTIRDKLNTSAYKTLADWHKDMMLVWSNCILYNGKNDYGLIGERFRGEYEKQYEVFNMDYYVDATQAPQQQPTN